MAWAATLLLARLLTPRDYGIAGLAAIWSTWGSAIADAGISLSITSGPRLGRDALRRLHGLAMAVGAAVAALLALGAPLVSRLHGEPAMEPVVRLLAVAVLLDAARAVPVAALSRDLEFRVSALIEFARAVGQTLTVIGLAAAGFGYWALAGGVVLSSLLSTLLAASQARLRPAWPAPVPPGVLGRARVLFTGYLAWQAYRGADLLLVGRAFGVGVAGSFSIARTVAWLPTEKLVTVLTGLTQSFFAHLADDRAELQRYLVWLTEGIVLVALLPLVGLGLTADVAVPVILGAKWEAAVAPLRWLLVPTCLGAVSTILSQVAAVLGGERQLLQANVASLALTAVAYGVVGPRAGLTAALAAWAAASMLVFCWLATVTLRRAGLGWARYLRSWQPGLLAAVAMTLGVLGIRAALPASTPRPAVLLAAAAGGGAIALLVVARTRSPFLDAVRGRLLRRPR